MNAEMPGLAAVVAHCDWSKRKEKRWMMVAVRQDSTWLLTEPEPIENTSGLVDKLQSRRKECGSLLIGFDFPIGLPVEYGRRTGFADFRHAIREFGSGHWSLWYDVAEHKSEISIHRPFYPMRPGGTSRTQLLKGLQINDAKDLLRRCERATDQRKAACMLFWTLGGNQVGKAAISGWREVIEPNLDKAGLWPFDGPLPDLLRDFPLVLAETYPGDVYSQLEIPKNLKWSKRRQAGRRSVANYLHGWWSDRPVSISERLKLIVDRGFAAGPEGEDQFDSMVGLFGMLDVIEGRR